MRIVLLVIVLIISAAAQAQPVYKWTDAQGVVHYGDRPPADTKSEEVAIEAPPPAAVGRIDVQSPRGPSPRSSQLRATSQQSRPLDIVMYARADCGYCAKARRYFAERGIAYVEKDVQRYAQATAEWKRLGGVGVPLFVINGDVSSGFSAEGMTKRLTRYGW